jgi:alkanesulfonate monooxygenase SsuD/methylene tetrahydromethanopterin reductase-like flavin-dependent oxidoreductase (luciferase family)
MEGEQRPVHPWVAEGARRVRFGIDLGPFPTLAANIEWAQAIEELGYDSFWLRDHPARAPEDPFTYLAAIAAVTRRIRLGTLVACVHFRHPVLLARVAADVDPLSNGRLVLGLGAGWDRTEFARMDLPLPPPKERLDTLEETLKLLPRLWGDEPVRYEGRHLRVAGARVKNARGGRHAAPLDRRRRAVLHLRRGRPGQRPALCGARHPGGRAGAARDHRRCWRGVMLQFRCRRRW